MIIPSRELKSMNILTSGLFSTFYLGIMNLILKSPVSVNSSWLRVLHLENFKKHNKILPKDIGCLIHLRYLSLKGSNVCNVPSSIGNLRCLETLDLRINFYSSYDCDLLDYLYIPRVPNLFKYMKQLKHLYLPSNYKVCDKLELGNLSYLQTLVNVQPKTIKIPTLFKLNRLRVLKVRNNKRAQYAMQMLISRCPLIEKLNLYYLIKRLPEAHKFSPNLAKLTLRETYIKEDPMPTLEKVPNLKILRLLCDSFVVKHMVCSKGGFPQLRSLLLSFLNLEEWRVEEGAMPSLRDLTIDFCWSLQTIPDGLTTRPELEIIGMPTLQESEIIEMPTSSKDSLNEGEPDLTKNDNL